MATEQTTRQEKPTKDPVTGKATSHEWSPTTTINVFPPSAVFPQHSSATLLMPKVNGNQYANVSPDYARASFGDFIKWRFSSSTDYQEKPAFPEPETARQMLPSVPINTHAMERFSPFGCGSSETATIADDSLSATWTSHASFTITVGGLTFLTDPVWSDRASPVQCAGPKRMVPPPVAIDRLPYIDVVTISHNHYDHLDTATVKHLIQSNHKLAATRAGEDATTLTHTHPIFVVPMGMKTRWFESIKGSVKGLDMDKVVELMWWDTADVTEAVRANRAAIGKAESLSEGTRATITAVPVQHWTTRTSFDNNRELWCGFACTVKTTNTSYKFFHSGDTGYYKEMFQQIGNVCGPFDFSMIPIGAYEPRSIMANQHVSPFESVEIHRDIKSRHSAGMHWGTFMLTDEPVDEPPKALASALAHQLGLVTTEAKTDDYNADLIRQLRAKDFKGGPELCNTDGCLPYLQCENLFRALKHGETWVISNSGNVTVSEPTSEAPQQSPHTYEAS